MAQVMELEMSRTTDCLKCNFPREESKGARVCKKCGRIESQPKGSVHRGNITVVSETGVQVVTEDFLPLRDPLAAFLPPPVPEAPAYVEAVAAAVAAVEASLAPPMSTLAEYPLDPPTVADDAIPPVADASPASPSGSTPFAITAESVKPAGHSPLGGSGAKRWLNCTGSTALIQQLGHVDDDSEYSKEGTAAHELLAFCLEHGTDAEMILSLDAQSADHPYKLVKLEDAPYVQSVIDYVRSRPGRKRYEVPFHRPELHELFRGMVDVEMTPMMGEFVLEVLDYKHGAGVYVPVVRCEQLMYYAAGIIMEDESFYPDEGKVRLTIAQPRLTWMDDPIRHWDTTVGGIKRWLHEECLPAMNVRTQDMVLSLGAWCQFCPAKLVCRAMTELYKRFSGASPEPLAMSDTQLGSEFEMAAFVRMRAKAVEQEVLRRLTEGKAVPLAQLERGKTDRVWKNENVVTSHWREQAYEAKLRSPAAIEKLPGGKEFVAEWAYQPEGALKAGLASGGGRAVTVTPPEERYAGAAEALFANKTA